MEQNKLPVDSDAIVQEVLKITSTWASSDLIQELVRLIQ